MSKRKQPIEIGDEVSFYFSESRKKHSRFSSGVVEGFRDGRVVVSDPYQKFTQYLVDPGQVAKKPGALAQRIYRQRKAVTISKTKTVKRHNPSVRPATRPKISLWEKITNVFRKNF